MELGPHLDPRGHCPGGSWSKRGPGFDFRAWCLLQIATCKSLNGNPMPRISWYRNGQQLEVPTEVNPGEMEEAQQAWVGGTDLGLVGSPD